MVIFVNYKGNYEITTTTANKSIGFDLSATQFCILLEVHSSSKKIQVKDAQKFKKKPPNEEVKV